MYLPLQALRRSFFIALFSLVLCQAAGPPSPPPPPAEFGVDTPPPSSSLPPTSTFTLSSSSTSGLTSSSGSLTTPSHSPPFTSSTSTTSTTSTFISTSTFTSTSTSTHTSSSTDTATHTSSSRSSPTPTPVPHVDPTSTSSASHRPISSGSTSPIPSSVSPTTTSGGQPTTSDPANPTPSSDPNQTNAAGSSSTPFRKNKAALVGTIVTVCLASLALIWAIGYLFIRRRQRRLETIEAEDFFDKGESVTVRGGPSPGPSMSEVTMPARPESYVSRDIHFGVNYAGQGAYGLDNRPRVPPNAHDQPQGSTDPGTTNPPAAKLPSQSYLTVPSPDNGQNPFADDDSFYGYIDTTYGEAV